jgi:8-oxo-dGTP pyrophosphatase MutT (NUDIX family)
MVMARIMTGDRIGKQGTLRVGCSAVIFDDQCEKISVTRREDNRQWCLPSGGMHPGDSAIESCVREVEEETGLTIAVKRLIGVYTTPHELIEYRDGTKVQLVGFCFEAEAVGGALRLSDETTHYGCFSFQEIQDLDILLNHPQRIRDTFSREQMTFVR